MKYVLKTEEKKVISDIDNSPSFQPTETLKDYIEKRERWKVVKEIFYIMWRLISSENWIWYSEFRDIELASLKLDEKNEVELEWLINFLEKKISDTSDIKKSYNLLIYWVMLKINC